MTVTPPRLRCKRGAIGGAAARPACGVGIPRDDQKLVQVVEEFGASANGHCAELKIVEIPNEVKWEIENRHGVERVSKAHPTWAESKVAEQSDLRT
jgi:hypothetical protein